MKPNLVEDNASFNQLFKLGLNLFELVTWYIHAPRK